MTLLLPVTNLISRAILTSSIKRIRPTIQLENLVNLVISQRRLMSSKNHLDDIIENAKFHEPVDISEYQSNEDDVFCREFVDMKVEDYEELYKNDESGRIKKTIETGLKEYEFMKYNCDARVPAYIDVSAMDKLVRENTTTATRAKYFEFLFKREMFKRTQALKKQRRADEREARRQQEDGDGLARTGLLSKQGELLYGLWHNSLFCRIPENKLRHGNGLSRLIQAAQYGNKLVYDFGFESYMTPWIARNSADQLREAVGLNRLHYEDPFDVWFCNYTENSECDQFFTASKSKESLINNGLVTIKNDCFTNHFDKSRLVYLSPNAKEKLTSIGRNDDVYIIGVYNDKSAMLPLSYKKAMQLGIRCKCLPLDSYVAWNIGSKSLCINHVTGVLLEFLSNGGNWEAAFKKHIPSRKIKTPEMIKEEESRKLETLRKKRRNHQMSMIHSSDFKSSADL